MGARRVGGPEGWGPDLEKVRAKGWGPKGGGPKAGRSKAVGPKFRAFFPLPLPFSLFFSLWGSSRGILVVF